MEVQVELELEFQIKIVTSFKCFSAIFFLKTTTIQSTFLFVF